jgi:LysR family transcriptional regulator, glycine cleavage system transcriptional activator
MRRLPSLIALRFFEETARHCSFNRAATALCVTQSAVSRQIRILENTLDTQLFVRNHHGVHLTAVGTQLLACITEAFDTIEQGTRQLACSESRAKLILAVPPTFATQWLSPRLESLIAQLPDVELSIRTASGGDEHCCIRFDRQPPHGQPSELLWMEQHVLVGAKQRDGQSVKTLLAQLPAMHILHEGKRLDMWSDWLTSAGFTSNDVGNAIEFSNLEQAIQAARKDAGVAIVDYNMIIDELREEQLVMLSSIEVGGPYGYWLDILPQHAASASVQIFTAWLREQVRRSG